MEWGGMNVGNLVRLVLYFYIVYMEVVVMCMCDFYFPFSEEKSMNGLYA